MLEERLPAVIKREWSKEVNKDNSKVDPFNKFPEFMTFLLEQKRIIEYEMIILRVSTMPKNDYGVVNYGKIENSVGGENVISGVYAIRKIRIKQMDVAVIPAKIHQREWHC